MISSKLAVLTEQLYVTLESRFSIIGTISEILSVWLQHSAVFCLWQSEKYIAKYQHSANMMIRTMKVSKAVKRGLSTVIEQCSVTCWEIHFFVCSSPLNIHMPQKRSYVKKQQNFPGKDWGGEKEVATSIGKMEKSLYLT